MINIKIIKTTDKWSIATNLLREKFIRYALNTLLAHDKNFTNCYSKIVLSVLLCGDRKIRTLNKEYRQKDKPTNVLSFPIMEDFGNDSIILGDVVISINTLLRECSDMKIDFDYHLCHLFIHSVLHLLGYDHENDNDAKIMENMERNILSQVI